MQDTGLLQAATDEGFLFLATWQAFHQYHKQSINNCLFYTMGDPTGGVIVILFCALGHPKINLM
jgi:hypothetical protein